MLARQDLSEQITQEKFAHAAVKFGRAHDVNEFLGRASDFVDLADLFPQIAHDFSSFVEPCVHGSGWLLKILDSTVWPNESSSLLKSIELLQ